MTFIAPAALRGDVVELTPMEAVDRPGLVAAASDGALWTLFYTRVPSPDRMAEAIDGFLHKRDAGLMMPFTVRRIGTGEVIGMTTFCNVDAENRRLEIGYTWYAGSAQGTAVNPDCKLLLLTHAFDNLDCIAVEFRTHWHNHRSRRALERLGAKQDGVLRNHMIMPDGSLRDTVVFSIIEPEWPAVRNELRRRLAT